MKLKYFLIIFSYMYINVYSTQIEYIYGNYKYVGQDISIEFTFNNNGITNFKIDNKNYSENISHKIIGIYGSTYIMEITINIDENKMLVLNMIILANKNKIYANSCLFVEVKFKNDVSFDVLRKKSIDFNISKVESFD